MPKWQIVQSSSGAATNVRRPGGGTLTPRSGPRRATLLTSNGPVDVCILKSKAVACPRTGKFKCPVPNCTIDGRSRVGIAKHFRKDHKNYRSWRDVFISKDAPNFVLRTENEETEAEPDSTAQRQEEPITGSSEVARITSPLPISSLEGQVQLRIPVQPVNPQVNTSSQASPSPQPLNQSITLNQPVILNQQPDLTGFQQLNLPVYPAVTNQLIIPSSSQTELSWCLANQGPVCSTITSLSTDTHQNGHPQYVYHVVPQVGQPVPIQTIAPAHPAPVPFHPTGPVNPPIYLVNPATGQTNQTQQYNIIQVAVPTRLGIPVSAHPVQPIALPSQVLSSPQLPAYPQTFYISSNGHLVPADLNRQPFQVQPTVELQPKQPSMMVCMYPPT